MKTRGFGERVRVQALPLPLTSGGSTPGLSIIKRKQRRISNISILDHHHRVLLLNHSIEPIMTAQIPALFRLKASTQAYDWGKKGSSSLVAELARGGVQEDFELDEETCYAEVRNIASENIRCRSHSRFVRRRCGWALIKMDRLIFGRIQQHLSQVSLYPLRRHTLERS